MPTWDQINEAREGGLLALSRELADRYLRDQPYDIAVLCLQIENLVDLSLYQEAEQLIDRALNLAPPHEKQWIFVRRGYLLEATGKLDGAVEAYLQAHDCGPDDAGHLIFAGVASLRLGARAIAMEFLHRATECSKGAVEEAHFNLAGCYLSQRQYVEARKGYLRALEIDPAFEPAKRRLEDIERALLLRHAETVSLHLVPPQT